MSMRMVLKSTDSLSTYTDNRPSDFRVRLPRTLPLSGDWTIELTEFINTEVRKTSNKEIFLYCSVCDDTIVGEHQKPLLRRIVLEDRKNVIFLRPYRVPLRTNDLDTIHLYIRDGNDVEPSFLVGTSTVTLVLRRR
jgi:hypothetical protein